MTNQSGSSAFDESSRGANRTTTTAARTLTEQSGRVADEVKQLGRTALDSAHDAATHLREGGGEMLAHGRERAMKAKSELDKFIGANPMKSVLIALGVGAAIGMALRRRS